MSHPSGFVPIPFHLAGKVLCAMGIMGLGIALISRISQWFSLPSGIVYISIAFIVVGLYLIFVVPEEPSE